jgi:hypothetical protein
MILLVFFFVAWVKPEFNTANENLTTQSARSNPVATSGGALFG